MAVLMISEHAIPVFHYTKLKIMDFPFILIKEDLFYDCDKQSHKKSSFS